VSYYDIPFDKHRALHKTVTNDLVPLAENYGARLNAAWRGITGPQYQVD
jgi:hypothetical protein